MSKIQEALGRIQKGKATREAGEPPENDSVIVATLVDHGTEGESYTVSDKRLHVDREALRNAGLIASRNDEQLLADQYRDMKRPLIAHAFGKRAAKVDRGNLIGVTSALSGEGKTFTSINLALSMAQERDYSVLLVDADVAKPQTSEIFGAADEPGLLDALEDRSALVRSMVLPTDVNNLSLLPAGKPRRDATELLASEAMDEIVEVLLNLSPQQIVIFDTPPLLQTSEAKVISSLAGQVVIVVRAEETPQEAVSAAVSALDQDKAINMVLNQARSGVGEYGFGYGYGYSQGRGTKSSDYGDSNKESSG